MLATNSIEFQFFCAIHYQIPPRILSVCFLFAKLNA